MDALKMFGIGQCAYAKAVVYMRAKSRRLCSSSNACLQIVQDVQITQEHSSRAEGAHVHTYSALLGAQSPWRSSSASALT